MMILILITVFKILNKNKKNFNFIDSDCESNSGAQMFSMNKAFDDINIDQK